MRSLSITMASLADQLLNERRTSVSTLHGESYMARPQHRMQYRTSINEVMLKVRHSKGSITLDEREVRILRGLIEKMDVDPFSGRLNGQSFLNTADLGNIGLGDDADEYAGLPTDYDDSDLGDEQFGELEGTTIHSKSAIRSASDLIPVEQALVAPLSTPHAEEEIPDSVLNSLKVLQAPRVEEKPLDQLEPAPDHLSNHGLQPVNRHPHPEPTVPEDELNQTVDQVQHESKKKPTQEELTAAMLNLSGGKPGSVSRLQERLAHPEPQEYEAIMLAARKRKNGSTPPSRSNQRRTFTEDGHPVQETEAMRAANRAVQSL